VAADSEQGHRKSQEPISNNQTTNNSQIP